jgi:glutathione S-transferase
MSTASTYKLSYFDGRGLGEISRLVFTAAGVAFEDFRYGDSSERKFPDDKSTFTFEKMPELLVDGKVKIAQSKAIERFLARRFGLMGSNDIEAARIDMFVEQVRDIVADWYKIKDDKDKLAKFWENEFNNHLRVLNKNVDASGHLVGGKLSLADIHVYYALDTFKDGTPVTEKYPNLAKIRDTVANNDKIKAYVAKRKVTPW